MEAEAQTTSNSQQRGMTHRVTKQSTSQSNPQHNTMAGFSESSLSAPPAKDAIARSMSRYKGNRQPKTINNAPPLPVNFSKLPSTTQREDLHSPKVLPDRDSSREFTANARSGKEVVNRDTHQEEPRPTKQSRQFLSHEAEPKPQPLLNTASNGIRSRREPDLRRGEIEPKTSIAGADYDVSKNIRQPRQRGHESQPEEKKVSGHQFAEQSDTLEQGLGRARKPLSPTLMSKSSPKKTFAERMSSHIGKYHSSKPDSRADLKRIISTPVAIGTGAEITVPSFDAPISAVNAGERRVIVKFRDYLISLPVNPNTTPLDIIRATAVEKPELVDTTAFILLESFKQVGLERPLRKYEHIRDVLNSWDNDAQNTLVIVPSPTGGHDDDLDAKTISKDQPLDTSVYMYYSQKPGHWDKRWITLRSDGQVVLKKGSDVSNICHLSDFDIYMPTPRQMSKKIKPPKKVCFAVKSQQKSSMFLSTANFVHFFSTSDKDLASSWYKVVQQWRSWYLVNMMGKGQGEAHAKKIKGITDVQVIKHKGLEPTNGKSNANGSHPPSIETAVYHINSSKPESAQQRSSPNSPTQQCHSYEWPNSPRNYKETNGVSTNQTTNRTRSGPPISFPRKLTKDVVTGAATTNAGRPSFFQTNATKAEPEPFATNGLLGRTYSQRQKALTVREKDSGSISGQSLTTATSQPKGETGGLKRGSSQRQKPRPLVDLTPQYQEPPQHSRKGRGLTPAQVPAGGLVDIATSPDVAIQIPPTRAWRRPATADVGSGDDSSSPPTRPTTARQAL